MFILLLVMCVSMMISLAPNAGQVGCDFSAFPQIKPVQFPTFPKFGQFDDPFDVIGLMDGERGKALADIHKTMTDDDVRHLASEIDVTGSRKAKEKEKLEKEKETSPKIGDLSEETTAKKDNH